MFIKLHNPIFGWCFGQHLGTHRPKFLESDGQQVRLGRALQRMVRRWARCATGRFSTAWLPTGSPKLRPKPARTAWQRGGIWDWKSCTKAEWTTAWGAKDHDVWSPEAETGAIGYLPPQMLGQNTPQETKIGMAWYHTWKNTEFGLLLLLLLLVVVVVVCGLLFVVCCLFLVVGCWFLFCCLLLVVCRLFVGFLFVVCCLFVVCWLFFVWSQLLVVGRCFSFVAAKSAIPDDWPKSSNHMGTVTRLPLYSHCLIPKHDAQWYDWKCPKR